MENKLKVNIFMPFYLWNNNIDRVSLTHKILNYLKVVKLSPHIYYAENTVQ